MCVLQCLQHGHSHSKITMQQAEAKATKLISNLVPRAFARFRGSGTGSKGPGKHWSRDIRHIDEILDIFVTWPY